MECLNRFVVSLSLFLALTDGISMMFSFFFCYFFSFLDEKQQWQTYFLTFFSGSTLLVEVENVFISIQISTTFKFVCKSLSAPYC